MLTETIQAGDEVDSMCHLWKLQDGDRERRGHRGDRCLHHAPNEECIGFEVSEGQDVTIEVNHTSRPARFMSHWWLTLVASIYIKQVVVISAQSFR
jgi:hypothetical protein